jgi:hypothetical protein
MSNFETIMLWRPVGPRELELIKQLQMRAFPPRRPDQPIFYPVLSEEYAIRSQGTGTFLRLERDS